MSVRDSEIDHALDLFGGIEGVRMRRQTGAALVYAGDVLFATVGDGEIYLKARDAFAREMAAAGATQFAIERADGSRGTNCYWTLPPEARDDRAAASAWAARAIAALTERPDRKRTPPKQATGEQGSREQASREQASRKRASRKRASP